MEVSAFSECFLFFFSFLSLGVKLNEDCKRNVGYCTTGAKCVDDVCECVQAASSGNKCELPSSNQPAFPYDKQCTNTTGYVNFIG